MHPTQHSTITLRRPEPRILHTHRLITGAARSADTPGRSQPDARTPSAVLAAIAAIAATQSTRCVMISAVAVHLGLAPTEREWLLRTIRRLDEDGLILLSPVERPQNLALYQACWHVRNASGIPCHEVAVAERSADAPVRSQPPHSPLPPPSTWPRAKDHSSRNPTMQQCRIASLLRDAAETLQAIGKTSAGRAA